MLRTEVVSTNNLRKTITYKIFNIIVLLVVFTFFALSLNVFGEENPASVFFRENYKNIIQPIFMVFIIVLVAISMYIKTVTRSPKRLGYIEMSNDEIKFVVEGEVKEIITKKEIESIGFEYFSMRLRQNPVGSMNYLTLNTKTGKKTYEIVIENALIKAELGDLLKHYDEKIPIKVTYFNFVQRVLGDRDFKF